MTSSSSSSSSSRSSDGRDDQMFEGFELPFLSDDVLLRGDRAFYVIIRKPT